MKRNPISCAPWICSGRSTIPPGKPTRISASRSPSIARESPPRLPTELAEALQLFTAAGHQEGQANALNHIGWLLSQLGDYGQALKHCQQALALSRKIGARHIEADTLDSLGYAHYHLGQHAEAVACYQQALDIARELGFRYLQAESLNHLGDTYDVAGDYEAACTAWREALAILDDLQHSDAERVRARLDAAEQPAGIRSRATE